MSTRQGTRMLAFLVLVVSGAVVPGSGQRASGGTPVAWGIDDGSTYDFGQVTDVPAGHDFVAIAAVEHHSLAIKLGKPVGYL